MRGIRGGLVALLGIVTALSCAAEPGSRGARGRAAGPARLSLPATYAGELPCGDCPGIRFTLHLRPDTAFYLRMTYIGRGEGEGESFDDVGRWSVESDGQVLALRGADEAPVMFSILGADTLRKRGIEGGEIESELDYHLVRQAAATPIEPRLLLRGMYRYMADAGWFRECLTGMRLAVAQAGDNAALEAAYSKARREPGEELLVNVVGRVTRRQRMEGAGDEDALVVERFIAVWPDETCGTPPAPPGLLDTEWKLVWLGDRPVAAAGRSEPHLVLATEGKRAQGSGGCNRLAGSYQLEGRNLRFGPMAATRMMCPEGMEQEAAFLRALGATARWSILGRHLELYGAKGERLARFEAREPK
jgi:copper homeostasis protein (lipoprotein)